MKDSIKNFGDLKRIAERNGLIARTWTVSGVPGKTQQCFSIERPNNDDGTSEILHVEKTLKLSATWLFGYEEGLSWLRRRLISCTNARIGAIWL